tara:strand:+ start:223 stop:420 length:198 start_codon:yes stop_codon:yes gene_type:complete
MKKDKSTLGSKLKTGAKVVGGSALTGGGLEFLSNLLPLLGMKDGGRVRGCGIAKRGFGKAMKRKK